MDVGAAIRSVRYGVLLEGSPSAPVIRETASAESPKPKLLDRVRLAVRARHYSRRTEKAYVHWIKRYILFHDKRLPLRIFAGAWPPRLCALTLHSASLEAGESASRDVDRTWSVRPN